MEERKVFSYRLDFYYKSLIIYLFFLFAYSLLRGNFTQENFSMVFKDPIIYISLAFILFTLISLIVNAAKAKRVIFEGSKVIFQNRFGSREISKEEIIHIRFSRERGKRVDGSRKIRIIKLKLQNRKRYLKIRLGEFQNERSLIQEFKKIKP